jgi:hypothetical protein
MSAPTPDASASNCVPNHTSERHIKFGFWSLLAFLCMGIALEVLHGFKVSAYLDVGNETRRLLWTLSHAHGSLFALLNVAVGCALRGPATLSSRWQRLASPMLLSGSLLVPVGFFLGGTIIYDADPSVGILLVPLGALMLLLGVLFTALEVSRR